MRLANSISKLELPRFQVVVSFGFLGLWEWLPNCEECEQDSLSVKHGDESKNGEDHDSNNETVFTAKTVSSSFSSAPIVIFI
jgi:hypothetical protein